MVGSGALTGRQLNEYRLGRLVSEDSFGQVYETFHDTLRQALALRVLSERLTFAAGFEEGFWRVGKVLAGLEHPNLLTLDDYGMVSPYAYLVTALVEATSLEDWLRSQPKEPASPAQVMRIIGQLTSVLQKLHDAHVTHLGITPARVLLEPNGHLLLTSTGLPYLAEELWRGWNERRAYSDPVFLAPEQLDGSAPSSASCDVYAVGVILYRLLSGMLPFDGGSRALLAAKQKPPPALSGKKHAPPPALESITLRALHPLPEQRWRSISAFVEAFYDTMHKIGYDRSAGQAPGSAYHYVSSSGMFAETDAPVSKASLTPPVLASPGATNRPPRLWSIVSPTPDNQPSPAAAAPARPRSRLATSSTFVIFSTLKILLVLAVLGLLGTAMLYGYQRVLQLQPQPQTPTPSPKPRHGDSPPGEDAPAYSLAFPSQHYRRCHA